MELDDEFGCLTNAERLATKNPKLRYVEGWARLADGRQRGAHARCVAPNGKAVDPFFAREFPGKSIEYRENERAFEHLKVPLPQR